MINKNIEVPMISFLEVELIINDRLLENSIISIEQHQEVAKIIYQKISRINNRS